MTKTARYLTLFLLLGIIYWSFIAIMPGYSRDIDVASNSFSTDRALKHIAAISKEPHAVGFKAHTDVQNYIVHELEHMGLKPTLQEGYSAGEWANLSYATNILAKIKGKNNRQSLVLMSHYDSSPHSSLGASDAGSGVATILESIRAFISEDKTPENDIVILFTDAEELGLNGADLFVNKHPWAKDVGLVLNFEARGSGGPSYMLIETNQGNRRLIEEFTAANPEYPVANSLVYSIYKMLPNDTDLTIFREDGNIQGLNFAFIDDHFDYHTERDNYERLDRETLAHQGSYLMPLLDHFSNTDLSNLRSKEDYIYFTVPLFKTVFYPYAWIWPMVVLAVLLFLLLLFIGFKKKVLSTREIFKGFLPCLFSLLVSGMVGYYAWPFLNGLYPQYRDILHGFPYNGYTYILAFTMLSMAICFYMYHRFRSIKTPNLLVAPLVVWLLISVVAAVYLKGASFTIIPVFALLISFMIVCNQEKPSLYLLVFLVFPALTMFAPFVKMFPVGLGLKMLVSATVLTTLLFVVLLPIFGFYKHKGRLALMATILGLGSLIYAHFNSYFTEDNAKPSSLVYLLDANENSAQWATYDNYLTDWTKQYLGKDKTIPNKHRDKTIDSKYKTPFSYVSKAPVKDIPAPKIEKILDTIIENRRYLTICITPQRAVNRVDVFKNEISLEAATVNGVRLSDYALLDTSRKLVTHYINDNDYTEISLVTAVGLPIELSIFEASNDLLINENFNIPKRPKNEIPMPFVLNDAILLTKTIKF
ncbi:M28 family peptidase [Cellulophaga sp. F20128]|uniref:M28 family peptidase n=1 Tax=Cellulophaga sp. F20128 TaxID=2926413 RepID=UPI001FF3773C|nr:M28 family peptidase [Cellulophaga sp. F20128]MCK0155870.1 M28 family peptidase [Cellulophaga sp. F20128]